MVRRERIVSVPDAVCHDPRVHLDPLCVRLVYHIRQRVIAGSDVGRPWLIRRVIVRIPGLPDLRDYDVEVGVGDSVNHFCRLLGSQKAGSERERPYGPILGRIRTLRYRRRSEAALVRRKRGQTPKIRYPSCLSKCGSTRLQQHGSQ